MTFEEFKDSLNHNHPPQELNIQLQSLWFDGKGNWEHAHDLVNDLTDEDSAYVHAYLHRKEGDQWNASYWYRNANKPKPSCSLEEEWKDLVVYFL
ncbi:hypothetical protein IFO69_14400 [Echinicola sp. CAU 1574]|uniref:Uncharacterized protein n=1 Tax=Echinicola arenosa TaxID=2774144 RepID=A0ABR9AMB6_9BACT|nr:MULTISPECIES: hypothetical protein [Echinicola]MBD8489944.1 hypothetical protein [Echinicola arenosa]